MNDEPDIVIVGAGAAGAGAARRLAGSGLSTLVLEALPRTGGRAWTRETARMPLDLGCGWLHSAGRNPWVHVAEAAGFPIDRTLAAWGNQFRDLGFPPADREAARDAYAGWNERLAIIASTSDVAADALEPGGHWTAYLQAISGFISGDELERISAKDYAAYDEASTDSNWRVAAGYGTLISASFPAGVRLQTSTVVEAISLDHRRVTLQTSAGSLHARAMIFTASTNVLAGTTITLPPALDPWRDAATRLPLGNNEKLFLEIVGNSPFEPESHILGDPHDATTGSYYIRPFGRPVIECFLGGAGARAAAATGHDVAFARAIDQLAALFGSDIRRTLKPLIASDWAGTASIGGAYSHALPRHSDARLALARPFDDRLFFAGEATHTSDFSTAHGAYQSGARAAEEAIAALGSKTAS